MLRAFMQYYLAVNAVNISFCFLMLMFTGLLWLPVLFCSIGIAVGIGSYNYFFSNQYYFYYNLGFTRRRLAIAVLACNFFIALLPALLIYLLNA
ncbi:MAG: hypothetical protein CMP77_03155 [Flavobacterium sp.]|nr:hypothetical protein [Flavobacterium sp.]|tara:strand:+ start:16855 stop:17136 length:282 start_codon:yes stop_codon:yes gene_type:complete